MPAVPDVPGLLSAEELAELPPAELAARLAEAYRVIAELTARVQELAAEGMRLAARVQALERRAGKDSSRPPSSEPEITEHVAQAKLCPCCRTVSEGELPAGVRARASFGPEAHAQAANLTSGNYVPADRAAQLMREMAGLRVSVGWIAGVRAKAAVIEASGSVDLVRELTPASTAGGLRYGHLACTAWLTCMHTGDRSADAVDADGVLPGYTGIIVRDGYQSSSIESS